MSGFRDSKINDDPENSGDSIISIALFSHLARMGFHLGIIMDSISTCLICEYLGPKGQHYQDHDIMGEFIKEWTTFGVPAHTGNQKPTLIPSKR